jgi:tRNA pseudouridine13 synthase
LRAHLSYLHFYPAELFPTHGIMKVKQQPEDFQVEELTDVAPDRGDFALYRLAKRGWTTPDALLAVRRRWRIDAERLSCGGLKDRHAQTSQFFTIAHGPRRGLQQQHLEVGYLGQVPRPFTSTDIRANRFILTIRDLAEQRLSGLAMALDEVQRDGVPNYYDDQRFGSVLSGGECMARALVQNRFEDAI